MLIERFCPGGRVHKGITIVLSLFRGHWLAVVYCLVNCIGSCEPVHEDNTDCRSGSKSICDVDGGGGRGCLGGHKGLVV